MEGSAGNSGRSRFTAYAWLVLGFDVLVILWGTVVRATGSGNGCGDHWPLCNGQVIPHAAEIATAIEFAHRLTSALALVLVAVLAYWAFRKFAAGHAARRYAGAALFFTLTEGLIGAALVLFGDVGNNVSVSRVGILSLHLTNTFLLLASLALTARAAGESWHAGSGQDPGECVQREAPAWGLITACAVALTGTLGLAVTGTIAALADALFHPTSLAQGFQWDFSAASSPILRLRVIHPVIAVFVGTFLMVLAAHTLSTRAPASAKRAARYLLGLVALQFCLGALNVALLAPVWMQVLHLLTADLIWITLVLLSADLMSRQKIAPVASSHQPIPLASESISLQDSPIAR